MNAIATIGRPSALTPSLADEICRRVANGEALSAIGEELGFDSAQVSRWRKRHETFNSDLADAKQARLEAIADEIIPLSDAAQGMDAAGVQAVKLRTDNRKWMLSKLMSHTYGDKLDVTSKGEALAAPSHQVDARVQSIVMQAAMRMQAGQADNLDDEAKSLLE